MTGCSALTRPSWTVIAEERQLRQQASGAAGGGDAAASSGRARSRSASLKAWLGMRARFRTAVWTLCGTSGLTASSPPCALRRLRESTQPPAADLERPAVLVGDRIGIE